MKVPGWLVLWASCLLAGAVQAQVETRNYGAWTENTTITDLDPTGSSFTKYISSDLLSLTSISVTLNISGHGNGDLYAYLTNAGTGQYAVLLNRPGWDTSMGGSYFDHYGYLDSGYNITIKDGIGAPDIHTYHVTLGIGPHVNYPNVLTGTWSSDGRTAFLDNDGYPIDVFNSDPRTATLNSFIGLNPSGDWTLFIADLSAGQESVLNSWALEMMGVVPEPTSMMLVLGGVPMLWWVIRRRKN